MPVDSENVITYDPAADYYRLLGVPPTATPEAIQRAYRERAKQVHPDRNPRRRAWAHAQFQQLNAVKDVLLDPACRAEYDRQRTAYLFSLFGEPQKRARPSQAPPPSMSRREQYRDQMVGAVMFIFLGSLVFVMGLVFDLIVLQDRTAPRETRTFDQLAADADWTTEATIILHNLDCESFSAGKADSYGLLHSANWKAVAVVHFSGKPACRDLQDTAIRVTVRRSNGYDADYLPQRLVSAIPQASVYYYLCQPCADPLGGYDSVAWAILLFPTALGVFAISYGLRKQRQANRLL